MRNLFLAAAAMMLVLDGCSGAALDKSNAPESLGTGEDRGGGTGVGDGTDDSYAPAPSGESSGGGQGSMEPGILTAADWDDNLNPAFYLDFLASVDEQGANTGFDALPAADRIVVKVMDGQSIPARNATVTVKNGETGDLLETLVTGSDGRTLFFPSLDGSAATFAVDVTFGGGSTTQSFASTDTAWNLVVPATAATVTPALDLAIVIDNTGSMGDETQYLQAELSWVISQVAETNAGVRLRFALVAYRDEGDEFVVQTHDFTESLEEMLGWVELLQANGGGDYPESVAEALDAAMRLSWSGDDAVRVAFWIGDAPPQLSRELMTADAAILARAQAIRVYPVAASGVDTTAEWVMRQMAAFTSARYLFLTDDSGVGGEHMEPHIPCYLVQKLNVLMVRVLRSEVAGSWQYPAAEEIIRTAGEPADGACVVGGNTYYY